MPDQADPDASPWRRYLRFSMRRMIVLVLLTGVCLGWVVRAVRTAHLSAGGGGGDRTVRRLLFLRLGMEGWTSGLRPGRPLAGWLVDRTGVDYFGTVVRVYCNAYSRVTDDVMFHVGQLSGLRELALPASACTDTGLANLKALSNLEILDLGETQITDAGLAARDGSTPPPRAGRRLYHGPGHSEGTSIGSSASSIFALTAQKSATADWRISRTSLFSRHFLFKTPPSATAGWHTLVD